MLTGKARGSNAVLLPPRDRAFIGSSILLVSALAWGYLAHLDHQMSSATGSAAGMARMGMAAAVPWRAADVLFTFAMWTVMMVAMMSATATPMLLLVAAIHGRRAEHAASMAALPFGLGYLAVWLGFSACATLAQWALHDAALLSPAMATVSPRLAGALLVGAGLFQLT